MPSSPDVSLQEPRAGDAPAVPAKLFIIDDDRSLLSLLKLIFEDASFSVRTYLDATRALAEVKDIQPDAIILDLEMPVMNGRAFYRALRQDGHKMPVLILSAYGARSAQAELGAEAAVDKPFEPDDLVAKISGLIGPK